MSRAVASSKNADVARNLDRVAWLMDRAIGIPGTKIRVGLDALLGLVPLGGDAASGLVQVGLVLVALKHYHVPRAVAARMIGNVLLDVGVGAVPILGDLFDVAFKANTRNLKLLEAHRDREPSGPLAASIPGPREVAAEAGWTLWKFVLPLLLILAALLVLIVIGFVALVRWAIN